MPIIAKPNNADAVLIELMKLVKPSITAGEIVNELSIHPEYPALLALNDVIANFGVECGGYRVSANELAEVPLPFIAQSKKEDTKLMLVTRFNRQQVTVTDHLRKNYTLTYDEFIAIFNNIVLTVEAPVATPAKSLNTVFDINNYSRFSVAIILLIFALVAGIAQSLPFFMGWQTILAIIFKTAGVIVSLLLLTQSIDSTNPLVQSICGTDSRSNCNAILSSKAATIFHGLSWSEVGFFYFAGSWLAMLLGANKFAELQILAFLNIACLPYTIYSIYYQAKVAKQWCVLCCTIQALLWLEFTVLISALNTPLQINITGWITLLICFALPIAGWLLLKPLLLAAQQSKLLKAQLRTFKYNTQLFNSVLQNQPKYTMPATEWSIVLGNAEAGNIITMVSNPFCEPCAQTHQVLHEWLNQNPDIQLRLVFATDNYPGDLKIPVARHLMALDQLSDKNQVKQALHNWYGQKQKVYEAWASRHPVTVDDTTLYKLEKQREWCNMAGVTATPTLLVNGYRLPEVYQIQDIKYLLVQQ